MRIDTDLDLLDAELAKSGGFLLVDDHPVGLHFYVDQQLPRPLHDFKKVPAHENFTPTEGEEKYAGIGELGEHIGDFCRRHLAMIVMVQVAMHAALIAAVRDIKVNADGHAQLQCFLIHISQKAHRLSGDGEESTGAYPEPSRSRGG